MTLADNTNASTAQEQIGAAGQLSFYAWEPNVIGPSGQPAPAEGTVTGDTTSTGAGGVISGLLEYQAVLRAARRRPLIRANDTTLSPGCTAAQIDGCLYGSWYLVGSEEEQVHRGPEPTKQALYAEDYEPQADATWRAVHVNPGTVLVQALAAEDHKGEVVNASPNSWYVLNDDPVLSGADIIDPQQGAEGDAPGEYGQPNILFGFTARGKRVFELMTREAALRGREAQDPGVPREAAEQHFAVVLDGQLLTVPSIDYARYPNGINAANGSHIAGGLTVLSAQNLADELRSGSEPIRLTLSSSTRLPAE